MRVLLQPIIMEVSMWLTMATIGCYTFPRLLEQVQGQRQIKSMDSRISPPMQLTMARQGSITHMELLSIPKGDSIFRTCLITAYCTIPRRASMRIVSMGDQTSSLPGAIAGD